MRKYATRQRAALLEYLQAHADEILSAGQIADALTPAGISKSAVYRNLSALESEGQIKRNTKSGSKTIFYRYLDAEACRDHLHLSCSKCGKTYHLDVNATSRLLDSVAQGSDFKIDSASTVLYGVCASCRDKE